MSISGHSDLFYIAMSYGVAGVVLVVLSLHSICAWRRARKDAADDAGRPS